MANIRVRLATGIKEAGRAIAAVDNNVVWQRLAKLSEEIGWGSVDISLKLISLGGDPHRSAGHRKVLAVPTPQPVSRKRTSPHYLKGAPPPRFIQKYRLSHGQGLRVDLSVRFSSIGPPVSQTTNR
jgi:hypothetical protein